MRRIGLLSCTLALWTVGCVTIDSACVLTPATVIWAIILWTGQGRGLLCGQQLWYAWPVLCPCHCQRCWLGCTAAGHAQYFCVGWNVAWYVTWKVSGLVLWSGMRRSRSFEWKVGQTVLSPATPYYLCIGWVREFVLYITFSNLGNEIEIFQRNEIKLQHNQIEKKTLISKLPSFTKSNTALWLYLPCSVSYHYFTTKWCSA